MKTMHSNRLVHRALMKMAVQGDFRHRAVMTHAKRGMTEFYPLSYILATKKQLPLPVGISKVLLHKRLTEGAKMLDQFAQL